MPEIIDTPALKLAPPLLHEFFQIYHALELKVYVGGGGRYTLRKV
jgi:hypothetical protein